MSEQEDKAQKLKEIQERLAEIQNKSKPVADKPSPEKEAPKKEVIPKVEEKKPEIKKEITEQKPKTTEPSPAKPSPPPVKFKAEVAAPKEEVKADNQVKEAKKEARLTQEETNWRANKLKNDGSVVSPAPKKSSSSSLSKIYTIVSLVITVLVCSYLAYTYFLDPDHTEEIVVSDLPKTIDEAEAPEVISEEEVVEEEEFNTVNTEAAALEEVKEVKTEENKASRNQTVTRERKIETKPPSTSAEVVKVSTVVPKGIIISYASNSSSDMAMKNVNYLTSKGFRAAYYYMPDKEANSPKLYKVYVGPFGNDSEAMPEFKKVVALNDKAFILRMD